MRKSVFVESDIKEGIPNCILDAVDQSGTNITRVNTSLVNSDQTSSSVHAENERGISETFSVPYHSVSSIGAEDQIAFTNYNPTPFHEYERNENIEIHESSDSRSISPKTSKLPYDDTNKMNYNTEETQDLIKEKSLIETRDISVNLRTWKSEPLIISTGLSSASDKKISIHTQPENKNTRVRVRSELEIPKLFLTPRVPRQGNTYQVIGLKEMSSHPRTSSSDVEADDENYIGENESRLSIQSRIHDIRDSPNHEVQRNGSNNEEEVPILPIQNLHNLEIRQVDNRENGNPPGVPLALNDNDGELDHSVSSENLDNGEENETDDSDFDDLPLEANDEKFILYSLMLS